MGFVQEPVTEEGGSGRGEMVRRRSDPSMPDDEFMKQKECAGAIECQFEETGDGEKGGMAMGSLGKPASKKGELSQEGHGQHLIGRLEFAGARSASRDRMRGSIRPRSARPKNAQESPRRRLPSRCF